MENKKMYKIIIADDHGIVRSGINFTLNQQKNLLVEEEASSYKELMEILSKKDFDLLILDLNLGDKNGIFSINEISDTYRDLPILVLSMFPEDPYAIQSIQAGASGYLNKKMVSEELLDAIHTILDGHKYLSEAYLETLPYGTSLEKTSKSGLESLSKREFEVYSYLASGMTFKEIADQLELSQKTISTYRTRILEKLSLSNTTQLIHFSLQHSLGEK